jgi:hypothetical protein
VCRRATRSARRSVPDPLINQPGSEPRSRRGRAWRAPFEDHRARWRRASSPLFLLGAAVIRFGRSRAHRVPDEHSRCAPIRTRESAPFRANEGRRRWRTDACRVANAGLGAVVYRRGLAERLFRIVIDDPGSRRSTRSRFSVFVRSGCLGRDAASARSDAGAAAMRACSGSRSRRLRKHRPGSGPGATQAGRAVLRWWCC